jgi:hypothetical protein
MLNLKFLLRLFTPSPRHPVTPSSLILLLIATTALAQDKPKVATFPLGGEADVNFRDSIGFAIREKLNRDGAYEALDGPMMIDMASMATEPVNFNSSIDEVQDLAKSTEAVLLIWGDCSTTNGKNHLRLHTLDLRHKDAPPTDFEADLTDGSAIRDVVEKFLAALPGVKPFVRPNEEAVHHDPASDSLFATNPNLVVNGNFAEAGHWTGIYQSDEYPLAISDQLPTRDRIEIYRLPADGAEAAHNVIAMQMSTHAAQNNGLAALSDPIPIQPGVRYRLSFRYRSDGPNLQVFVKGYMSGQNIANQPADVEDYRLQIPPSGGTGGKWKTVEADLEPRNPKSPVQRLRVDLFIYHDMGLAMFSDVQLKAVGQFDLQPATAPAN